MKMIILSVCLLMGLGGVAHADVCKRQCEEVCTNGFCQFQCQYQCRPVCAPVCRYQVDAFGNWVYACQEVCR